MRGSRPYLIGSAICQPSNPTTIVLYAYPHSFYIILCDPFHIEITYDCASINIISRSRKVKLFHNESVTILHQDKKRHYLKHIRNYIFIIFARIQVCYIFRIIFLNVSINIHTQCFGNMICTMVTVSPLDVCHWFTNIWLLVHD